MLSVGWPRAIRDGVAPLTPVPFRAGSVPSSDCMKPHVVTGINFKLRSLPANISMKKFQDPVSEVLINAAYQPTTRTEIFAFDAADRIGQLSRPLPSRKRQSRLH